MKTVWAGALIFIVVVMQECGAAADEEQTSKDCDPHSRYFFPVEEPNSSVSGVDAFLCDWFSRHLRSMDEPPLFGREHGKDDEAYRLLVLPNYDRPFVMRLERQHGGKWKLTEKATNGAGGYAAGRIIFNQGRTLTRSESKELMEAVNAIDLQHTEVQPIFEKSDPVTGEETVTVIIHGTQVAFETVRDGRYRVFSRTWHKDTLEPEFARLLNTFRKLSAYMNQPKPRKKR